MVFGLHLQEITDSHRGLRVGAIRSGGRVKLGRRGWRRELSFCQRHGDVFQSELLDRRAQVSLQNNDFLSELLGGFGCF